MACEGGHIRKQERRASPTRTQLLHPPRACPTICHMPPLAYPTTLPHPASPLTHHPLLCPAQFGYDDGLSLLISKSTTTFSVGGKFLASWLASFEQAVPPVPVPANAIGRHPPLPTGVLTANKMCSIVAALQAWL